jgi:M6 family metalloprotease-like protein
VNQRAIVRYRLRRVAALAVAIAAAVAVSVPNPLHAASVSPRVLEAARGTPEEAAVRERVERYAKSKSAGVDQIYPQFTLDMAKYPRDGVAHRNILVVLAEFPVEGVAPAVSASSKSTPYYYHRMFFSDDPNDGFVSLKEYYKINSNGRLIISGQVTSKWLTMPHSSLYYTNGASGLDFGGYPRSAQKLAEDAMIAASGDFDSKLGYFDNDGPDGVPASGDDDGYIDAVVVVHAGQPGEIISASNDLFWSHEAGIAIYSSCPQPTSPDCLPGIQLGGVRGFLYVMVGEYNDFPGDFAVGTYCHEFGHTLGLPDLYDPSAAGLGFFSLMALGNYLPYEAGKVLGQRPGNLDAWSRQYLGFDERRNATLFGPFTLSPVTRGGGSLRVWTNGEPGTEYFLLENRKREGPDEFLPGDGLVVYHVDDTKMDNLSGPPNYRVSVVQADGLLQLENPSIGGNFGDAADFFPGSLLVRSITEATTPSTRAFSGADTGIRITGIAGSPVDGPDDVSFNFTVSQAAALRVEGVLIDDGGGDGYADAGETVSLTVQLRNTGLASGSVNYILTSSSADATVNTGTASGVSIGAGAVGQNATPFNVTFGNPATLPRDVTFNLSWNDGTASGVETFLVTIGMGAGLADDLESGADGWSHAAIAPSVADDWHLSTSRAHGGATSFKLGSSNALGVGTNEEQTYAPNQDAALVSPAFDLAANSELVFWSYIDAETNGGTGCWDGGRVEISMNGGPWEPIAVDGGYGYQVEFNSGAALRGANVFSGSPKSWRRVVADLTPYSGAARLRFRFASDEANDPRDQFGGQLRYFEGWYVDDVAVGTRTGGGPVARRLTFRAGPNPFWVGGASSLINFRFSAPDGLPHPGATPEVRVFDVHGRQVASVTATANGLTPSLFEATWNAKNDAGGTCGSGIYFARIDFLGKTQTARLVLVH